MTTHHDSKYGLKSIGRCLANSLRPTHSTTGSTGVDLAAAQSVTLTDSTVTLIPAGVMGPLGVGRSAFLLGHSAVTWMGLLVLPGVTDADYTGEIKDNGMDALTSLLYSQRPKNSTIDPFSFYG